MGGAHNSFWYGFAFDLNTGKKMVLSDLFPQMYSLTISSLVKAEVKEYID